MAERDLRNYPGHLRQFNSKGSTESFTRINPLADPVAEKAKAITASNEQKAKRGLDFNIGNLVSALGGALNLTSPPTRMETTPPPMGLTMEQRQSYVEGETKRASAAAAIEEQGKERAMREKALKEESAYRKQLMGMQQEEMGMKREEFEEGKKARAEDLVFKRAAEERAKEIFEITKDVAEREAEKADYEKLQRPVEEKTKQLQQEGQQLQVELARKQVENFDENQELARRRDYAAIAASNASIVASMQNVEVSKANLEMNNIKLGWEKHDRVAKSLMDLTKSQADAVALKKGELEYKLAEMQFNEYVANSPLRASLQQVEAIGALSKVFQGTASESEKAIATYTNIVSQVSANNLDSYLTSMDVKSLMNAPSAAALTASMTEITRQVLAREKAADNPDPKRIEDLNKILTIVGNATNPSSFLNPEFMASFVQNMTNAKTPEAAIAATNAFNSVVTGGQAALNQQIVQQSVTPVSGVAVKPGEFVDLPGTPADKLKMSLPDEPVEVGQVVADVKHINGVPTIYRLRTVRAKGGEEITFPVANADDLNEGADGHDSIIQKILGIAERQKNIEFRSFNL